MALKKYLFGVCFVLALLIAGAGSAYAISFADYVFQNIQKGREGAVKSFLNKGYPVDAVNSEGLTALCQAVKARDYATYRKLRRLGANAKHKCISSLDAQTVTDFDELYSPTDEGAAGSEKISDDSKTLYWSAAGSLAAAGIGAGIYLSLDDNKKDDEPVQCDKGFELVDGICLPKKCEDGFVLVDGECVSTTCPDGWSWNGRECIKDCPEGTVWDGTVCRVIDCPPNTELQGGVCVSTGDLNFDYVGDAPLYGIETNKEDVYNLFSTAKNPKDLAVINLSNKGNGDAFGVYGVSNVTNAFASGVSGELTNTGKNVGNISITSEGKGTSYGLYSKISDITQYKEAINVRTQDKGEAYGDIYILHRGGGTSYGVFGDVRAYNAYAMNGGKSYGDITIYGDGDIYGISGYVAATNAVSPFFGSEVVGNINLYQQGNKDVYGMAVSKDDIPGAGAGDNNLASWFAFNAYSSGGDTVTGNINIRNDGDGNAYGMYGGQQLFNAMTYGGVNEETGKPNGIAKGYINILNKGNGDSFGMYLPDEDEDGIIGNINSNGSESVVSIVNLGSGTATGLRGGRKTTIINSGKIDINNLGYGTAIGIYGERDSIIENSGVINIHRDTYTDSETGIKYNPLSTKGGVAYGIYAESGARVVNTGDITITGAGAGKGIHLEDGATLENSGNVRFNGEEQNPAENTGVPSMVNLNEIGGEIILGKGGHFFADELRGDMGVSEKVVLGSFENEYVVDSALHSDNISGLNVYSKSAMFEADTRANDNGGADVVLSRKNLNTLLTDRNLGEFFEENYEQKNGAAVYDVLKKAESESALNRQAANLSGADVLPNFRRENALVYRHLSKQFDDNLFNRPDENYIGGYKYIDVSMDKDGTLTGSDGKVNAAYGMLKGKTDSGVVYGLGATIANLKSDYDNGANRKSNIFGLWAPVGYDFNNGTQWYSKFYAGYADGSYDRKTELGKFSADVTEYQYGISNELRHKMNLGNGFSFQPLAELNLLGIYQDGAKEGKALGALQLDSGNSLSLEGGLGAYLSKEMIFDNDNKLGIQIGGVYYVEFLDPDDGVDARMQGMNGKFRLKNKAQDDRAVFSLRADYTYKDLMLYAVIEQETGGNKAFSIDTGVQYKF